MSRDAAINYLRSLPEAQLASFVEEAFEHLADGNLSEGLSVFRLARCFTYQDSRGEWSWPPVVCLVAPPKILAECSEHRYLDQSGTCPRCETEVCCAAKVATCPLCKAEVLCT